MSTAEMVVLCVMKYGTVIVDGGLEFMWMEELNQHCVAGQKKIK